MVDWIGMDSSVKESKNMGAISEKVKICLLLELHIWLKNTRRF